MTLFSFSFMQIAYAHEARFYAMLTMLEAIDLYLVLLICDRSSPLRVAGVAIAWTCSLYTNNLMGVYLAFLAIAWMILAGGRPIGLRLRDATIVHVDRRRGVRTVVAGAVRPDPADRAGGSGPEKTRRDFLRAQPSP